MDPPRDRKGMPMHYAPRRKSPIPKVLAETAGSLMHTTFSLAGLRPAGRGRRSAA
jgi:hypothetical protein